MSGIGMCSFCELEMYRESDPTVTAEPRDGGRYHEVVRGGRSTRTHLHGDVTRCTCVERGYGDPLWLRRFREEVRDG